LVSPESTTTAATVKKIWYRRFAAVSDAGFADVDVITDPGSGLN
jgi:hypothetical protein